MPKEVTHIRRDHLILSASGALIKDCKTINAAKRESREMQKKGAVFHAEKVKKNTPKISKRRGNYRATPPKQDTRNVRFLGMSEAEVRRLQAQTDD